MGGGIYERNSSTTVLLCSFLNPRRTPRLLFVFSFLGVAKETGPSSPALRLCLTRTSPAQLAETQAQIDADRRGALAAAAASPSVVRRVLGTAGLRARHFAVDYAQGGLMMAVVGFKLMVGGDFRPTRVLDE